MNELPQNNYSTSIWKSGKKRKLYTVRHTTVTLRSHSVVLHFTNNFLTFLFQVISGVGVPFSMSHPKVAASPW